MTKKLRAFGVLGVLSVTAGIVTMNSFRAHAAEGTGGQQISELIAPAQKPVLNYDVTGGTLAGIIHFRLSVYDNGLATISQAGFSVFEPNDDDDPCVNDGRAAYTYVTTEEIATLRAALKRAGAFQATNGGVVTDTPLQSVTVFSNRGATSVAHSFSFYWANSPEILDTLEVINEFIDTHFPGY